MKRSTSANLSKYFAPPAPRPSSPTHPSLTSPPLSSRRKRKHVEVEFEPEKQNQVEETKEIKRLEKEIKKEFSATKNNKIKLWLSQAEKISEFRNKNKGAPVDDYGAEAIPEGKGKTFRYETLVSLMLSSQTKDQITARAVQSLKSKLNGGLTVDSVRKADEATLASLIKPVSFYQRKAVYLKKTAEILATKYKGDIPSTLEGLLDLPGVGPKMSYLTMQHAWDKCIGIGVDVHVHRISNRLGWVKTNKPEDTRKELEDWLPKSHWSTINIVLVGFGQTQCLPVGPKCSTCVVNDTCPTGIANLREGNQKKKKKKVAKEEADE
eukprot:Phypoly_transcript_13249.p1 GENE.Phypoly_transcript_13249~~Phypoly_transcript_13249.p1  ORF type:complete len:336 (+),score=63.96 Phypoly_transcript_13249:42-1010(+)